jgi:hypothetical protein
MKPGSWADTLLFALGSGAAAWGLLSWDAQESQSPNAHMHLVEALAFAGVASFWGSGVYQAAQKWHLRRESFHPRRGTGAIAAFLGAAFIALWMVGGRALDPALGISGHTALACVLPWVLSWVQWTGRARTAG